MQLTSRMRNQKSCCFDSDRPIGDEGVDGVVGVGGSALPLWRECGGDMTEDLAAPFDPPPVPFDEGFVVSLFGSRKELPWTLRGGVVLSVECVRSEGGSCWLLRCTRGGGGMIHDTVLPARIAPSLA